MSTTEDAVYVDLPAHKLGDVWEAVPAIGPVTIDGIAPAGALTRIRWQFRKGVRVFTLDSLAEGTDRDAPITITDPDTWEATVPEVGDFLPESGKWSWDIHFYEAGKPGPQTLYRGVQSVTGDVTKD